MPCLERTWFLNTFFVKRILYLQKNVYSDIFRGRMQNVRNLAATSRLKYLLTHQKFLFGALLELEHCIRPLHSNHECFAGFRCRLEAKAIFLENEKYY